MSGFKDYFSDAADDYRRFRPEYPDALFDYLATISPARTFAIDCGCGNGQASVALAARFDQVLGTDASASQIAQVAEAANLRYQVSPAETIPAPPGSVDLITVAQAIHWFDHPRFFAAADQALKPGGILAVWGYQFLHTDTALDPLITDFHSRVVGPYWPPERALLDAGYTRIPFPYPPLEAPRFAMEAHWTFPQLLGYLNTWSAVKQFEKANGFNPLEPIAGTLLAAWGDPQRAQRVYWPLILRLGRKSS